MGQGGREIADVERDRRFGVLVVVPVLVLGLGAVVPRLGMVAALVVDEVRRVGREQGRLGPGEQALDRGCIRRVAAQQAVIPERPQVAEFGPGLGPLGRRQRGVEVEGLGPLPLVSSRAKSRSLNSESRTAPVPGPNTATVGSSSSLAS